MKTVILHYVYQSEKQVNTNILSEQIKSITGVCINREREENKSDWVNAKIVRNSINLIRLNARNKILKMNKKIALQAELK